MNINNINPYLGTQNAIKSDSGNSSSADNIQVSSAGEGQSTNLTVVTDPPFLPIATYQRQDLIKKVRSLEFKIGHEVIDQRSQNTVSDIKAKSSETDTVRTVTSEKNQLGTILSIKI
jgi:hypothetical protein